MNPQRTPTETDRVLNFVRHCDDVEILRLIGIAAVARLRELGVKARWVRHEELSPGLGVDGMQVWEVVRAVVLLLALVKLFSL